MSAQVVHCKRDKYDVYIGRPGPWGNPFTIGRDGSRDEVIAKFEDYLLRSPALLARLPQLRGKVLGCWCAPQPCHGDVLAALAGSGEEIMNHDYLSTACYHEPGDPEMHWSCRLTCKFCGAPCQCARHAPGEVPAPATAGIGQARDIARQLLEVVTWAALPDGLQARINEDPALFWLRGEEQPPGTWRGRG